MPEPWQSWVKIDIDAWQGSATVQEMTDAEYRAYDNLLKAQFQQPDGMLPNDEKELAKLSRKRADWPQIREHVLEQFKQGPEGRIFNARMYNEWLKAQELHLKRRTAARQHPRGDGEALRKTKVLALHKLSNRQTIAHL